jgi:hypothetical protein
MTFEISDAQVIERTIVVSVIILIFGIASIGALWLAQRSRAKSGGEPVGHEKSGERPSPEQADDVVTVGRSELVDRIISELDRRLAEQSAAERSNERTPAAPG